MRRIKIKIQVVPLSVAQKALAEELKRERLRNRTKPSKRKSAKSGQL